MDEGIFIIGFQCDMEWNPGIERIETLGNMGHYACQTGFVDINCKAHTRLDFPPGVMTGEYFEGLFKTIQEYTEKFNLRQQDIEPTPLTREEVFEIRAEEEDA